MPGILPMKVIKIGESAQSRIAQACDRCRSKKIRCDGFRPCCTQCANVGFQCKTSDKLSRRAFPRGYTESLEERVRALETEVQELKDLLDTKDEKIDMLSKVHSNSPYGASSIARRASSNSTQDVQDAGDATRRAAQDTIKVQQPSSLVHGIGSDTRASGLSNGRGLFDAFKRKLQEQGKPYPSCEADNFFPTNRAPLGTPQASPSGRAAGGPPRLLSDQLVNIFFQEWAPLFPLLHHPSFLALYSRYTSNEKSVQNPREVAQLNLVFGIAALSSNNLKEIRHFESRWISALESFITETSLVNLQCLILAQLFCLQKGDYSKLLHYKAMAIGVSHRLGLHQSQKPFAMGALTSELRKRVFWTLYTLDGFSAAFLGLPRFLKDEDISCEYPIDADDECITEEGFQPTPPGESTKISSALALFRGSRVLCKVLDVNFSATSNGEYSRQSYEDLSLQLDEWYSSLAPHLRMVFELDKPSTKVISSRCPLLSLTYHYIRTLIHRPFMCTDNNDRASAAVVAVSSSSKHIVQIIQLLDERHLSFSHCFNKTELILVAGFGLMVQTLDLGQNSKLLKDIQRMLVAVISMLEQVRADGAQEFKRLGCSLLAVRRASPQEPPSHQQQPHRASTESPSVSGESMHKRKGFMDIARRYSLASGRSATKDSDSSPFDIRKRLGRSTMPAPRHSPSQYSNSSEAILKSESITPPYRQNSKPSASTPNLNLDYFSFATPQNPAVARTQGARPKPQSKPSLDNILENLGEARQKQHQQLQELYDWQNLDDIFAHEGFAQDGQSAAGLESQDSTSLLDTWDFAGVTPETNEFATPSAPAPAPNKAADGKVTIVKQTSNSSSSNSNSDHEHTSVPTQIPDKAPKPQSLQSFSTDSLTSGEEFSSIDTAPSRDRDAAIDALFNENFVLEPQSAGGELVGH
ncbi:MAG: hypothetical protein M1828_004881 [Chrysothrix sp. TS-e1954]|nr:MAG: hypothetical protein M1828_004881 [Chrysothrix sp. TS-e1954]